MLDLGIAQKHIVNKDIYTDVLNRLSDEDREFISETVDSLIWYASFRPHETGLASIEDETKRYEEFQIFEMSIKSHECIFLVSCKIMKAVSYPVILLIKYNNKYRITISKPAISKRDYTDLMTKSIFQTYWFYPYEPIKSPITEKIIQALDFSRYDCNSMYELYSQVYKELTYYQVRGLSKTRVTMLIRWLQLTKDDNIQQIYDYCTPDYYYPPDYKVGNYVVSRQNRYVLMHDYEDIWYALQHNEAARQMLENRKIYNMEELLFYSDVLNN